jgi:hypothetical protein
MSALEPKPDVLEGWLELRLLAEGVEELLGVRIFETMNQNLGRC